MSTPPIVTITDELLAEIEEECALAAELDINAAVVPAHITALLAHIADLKHQASEREAHVRNLIDSETLLFNYLADIRQAVGDDGRLMLPGLVEHIRGMSQQLVAAGVTAENCELFRKDAERYQWLRDDAEFADFETLCLTSLGEWGAYIDAARSTTDNTTEQPTWPTPKELNSKNWPAR